MNMESILNNQLDKSQYSSTKAAFDSLRPCCIQLAKNVTVDSLRALKKCIEVTARNEGDSPSDSLTRLHEYISLPVIVALRKSNGSCALQEEALQCLMSLVCKAKCSSIQGFISVFSQCFVILSNPENPSKAADCSEEVQLYALQVVCSLLKSCTDDVLLEFYIKQCYKGQIAHAVLLSLTIAQHSSCRRVRIQALQAVLCIGQQSNDTAALSAALRGVFKAFLPGICTACSKISVGDPTQGHAVTVKSLECLSYFITLVINDDLLKPSKELESINTVLDLQHHLKMMATSPAQSNIETVDPVDKEWLIKTAENVKRMLETVLTETVCHPHAAVRKQLALSAAMLLKHCQKSLTVCMAPCVEVLAALAGDSDAGVRDAANAVQSNEYSTEILTILQDRLCQTFKRLPVLASSTTEDMRLLSVVRQAAGSMALLGSQKCFQLFSLPGLLTKILCNIADVLSYQTADNRILSVSQITSMTTVRIDLVIPHRRYLSHSSHVSECERLVTLIGECVNVSQLLLCWNEALSNTRSPNVIGLLPLLFKGLANKTDSDALDDHQRESVVYEVVQVILTDEILLANIDDECDELVHNDDDDSEDDTPCINNSESIISSLDTLYKRFHGNTSLNPYSRTYPLHDITDNPSILRRKLKVLRIVTGLQVLKACAELMGHHFIMFLSSVVCSVLQHCGSTNMLIRSTAIQTADTIGRCCHMTDMKGLVQDGVNHYWYPLSRQLKNPQQYPFATQALQVALEHNTGNGELNEFMQHLLSDLIAALDTHHSVAPQQLLALLKLFLACRNREASRESQSTAATEASRATEEGTLVSLLVGYHEKKKELRDSVKAEGQTDQTSIDVEEELKDIAQKAKEKEAVEGTGDERGPDPNEVPDELRVVVEVLERCCYLLHIKERSVSLVLLDTLELGCKAISYHENTQLPVMHKIWKPLMLRIKDTDTLVMLKALLLCCTMVASSGDFLRKRCVTDLVPLIKEFLMSQCSVSEGKTERTGYLMTPQYGAQLKLLSELLPSLVCSLKLGTQHTVPLVNIICLYLDTAQPSQLIEASISLLRLISQTHPQIVWLSLSNLLKPRRFVPPNNVLFKVVEFTGSSKQNERLPPAVQLMFDELSYFKPQS